MVLFYLALLLKLLISMFWTSVMTGILLDNRLLTAMFSQCSGVMLINTVPFWTMIPCHVVVVACLGHAVQFQCDNAQ